MNTKEFKQELAAKLGDDTQVRSINTLQGTKVIVSSHGHEIIMPFHKLAMMTTQRAVDTIAMRMNWREKGLI